MEGAAGIMHIHAFSHPVWRQCRTFVFSASAPASEEHSFLYSPQNHVLRLGSLSSDERSHIGINLMLATSLSLFIFLQFN